jgi:hypothetical protein
MLTTGSLATGNEQVIGTSDTNSFKIKTNNTDRVTVASSGNVTLANNLTVTGKATSAATVAADTSTTLSTKGYVESTARIGTTICFSKVDVTNNPTITVAGVPLVVSGAVTGNPPSNSASSNVTFTFPSTTTWSGFACRISDGDRVLNRTPFNNANSVVISAFNEQVTSLVLIIATRVS